MAKRKKKPNPASALMSSTATRRSPVTKPGALNIFQNISSGVAGGRPSPFLPGGRGLSGTTLPDPSLTAPQPVTERTAGRGQNQALFDFFRKNPTATDAQARLATAPASFTPTPATVTQSPIAMASPSPQPTGGPNLRGGTLQDIFSGTKAPIAPTLAAEGIAITPAIRSDPTLLGGRVDPNAPDATAQARLDRIYGAAGLTAPKATKGQEERFQKRAKARATQGERRRADETLDDRRIRILGEEISKKRIEFNKLSARKSSKEAEILFQGRKVEEEGRRAERLQTRGSAEGYLTVGGRRGGTIDIESGQPGTREGIQLATEARQRFGEATGTQQISLGGKLYAIRADFDAQAVTESAEAFRQQYADLSKVLSYKDALAMAVDTETQISGELETPTIRKDGREVPIDFVLMQGARARAAIEAERTGLPVAVNRPSGANPRILGRQMLPSATAGRARRKADAVAAKKIANEQIRLAKGKPDYKNVKGNVKTDKAWWKSTGSESKAKAIDSFIKLHVEGETGGSGDDLYFLPGQGSLFHPKDKGGKKIKDGVIQPYEVTIKGLNDLWSATKAKFGSRIPMSILADRMGALFGEHSEWNQEAVRGFKLSHPAEFAAQLSAKISSIPVAPPGTGGPIPQSAVGVAGATDGDKQAWANQWRAKNPNGTKEEFRKVFAVRFPEN